MTEADGLEASGAATTRHPAPAQRAPTLFPLTLALSPGEREWPPPRCEIPRPPGPRHAAPGSLPLPEGEDWGDDPGAGSVNCYHAPTHLVRTP